MTRAIYKLNLTLSLLIQLSSYICIITFIKLLFLILKMNKQTCHNEGNCTERLHQSLIAWDICKLDFEEIKCNVCQEGKVLRLKNCSYDYIVPTIQLISWLQPYILMETFYFVFLYYHAAFIHLLNSYLLFLLLIRRQINAIVN